MFPPVVAEFVARTDARSRGAPAVLVTGSTGLPSICEVSHPPFKPVIVSMTLALNLSLLGLCAFVVVSAFVRNSPNAVWLAIGTGVFIVGYVIGVGVFKVDSGTKTTVKTVWLLALTVVWGVLVALSVDAAYLIVPMFLLYLWMLPGPVGAIAVVASAAMVIALSESQAGWTIGGVLGPLAGAIIAVILGLGSAALLSEIQERERLMNDLVEARDLLAAQERESGMMEERSRLAREIHDTLSQGLSSIVMLLHAAERADPEGRGTPHMRAARDTAIANLAEARRLIAALSPAPLTEQRLVPALRRLAATQWARPGLSIEVDGEDRLDPPMEVQTALLRIAQGAMANVLQHSGASHATISLVESNGRIRLTIADDGQGFAPAEAAVSTPSGRGDSFGLTATQERVAQLGGALDVQSAPGRGTAVVVELEAALS